MPLGDQVAFASLGFALALALAACLRGRPSIVASCLGLGGVWLAVSAIDVGGAADRCGVLAFLLGAIDHVPSPGAGGLPCLLAAGDLRGCSASFSLRCCSVRRRGGPLRPWYWLTPPLERVDADAGWYLGWFTGLGAFAGSMAAVVVWLAASGRAQGIDKT